MKRCIGIGQHESESFKNLNSKKDQYSKRNCSNSNGMDAEGSNESRSRRRVKRRLEMAADEEGASEMGIVVEENIINSETCDIKALTDALRRQHQANEKLQYELDEERNASAGAANEALAMIFRLQKEKHEIEWEASLSNKIHAYTEQEKLFLDDLLNEKDDVIEALRSEIQYLKQLGTLQQKNSCNVNHEIRSLRSADEFSEAKEAVNDHALLTPLLESTSEKKSAEQVEISIGDDIGVGDKESTNSETANEDDSRNLNICILITEKESNTSEVSDQAAHALAEAQLMEEDGENNDNCIAGSGFDFSVSDRLAHDEEVQQIIWRMQTLVEERKSMVQTIQHLKIQNRGLMEFITKFSRQHSNEEGTQKSGHNLTEKTTERKTRNIINTIARLRLRPGWISFCLIGWTILIVALFNSG